jgi:hypothetical protein
MSNKGSRDETNGEERFVNRRSMRLDGTTIAAAAALAASASIKVTQAQAQAAPSGRRPNILVIFGDDIGQTNTSAYSFGAMGYRTPGIDRIAREGMMVTYYYAEQSCTARRSSFITGAPRRPRVPEHNIGTLRIPAARRRSRPTRQLCCRR